MGQSRGEAWRRGELRLEPECVTCIFSQALRVCRTLGVEREKTKMVLDEVALMIPGFSFSETPPQVASRVYPKISELLGIEDLYKEYKKEATIHAAKLIPIVEERVFESEDRLYAALKASVAGNVIDLAATHTFDLEEEVAKVFETPFAIDDTKRLKIDLDRASSLLVIGDNAGEHLFDKLMMEQILLLFPDIEIYYATRGRPIINDITLSDAKAAGIDKIATLVDSGVDTPGFDLTRISDEARKIYESVDLVIAKGMGNYESLNDVSKKDIYFLMKVKCSVVAASLSSEIGDIICHKGAGDV